MNREKWLSVRNTPRKDTRSLRYLHVSTSFHYKEVKDPVSGIVSTVLVRPKGTTYRR